MSKAKIIEQNPVLLMEKLLESAPLLWNIESITKLIYKLKNPESYSCIPSRVREALQKTYPISIAYTFRNSVELLSYHAYIRRMYTPFREELIQLLTKTLNVLKLME